MECRYCECSDFYSKKNMYKNYKNLSFTRDFILAANIAINSTYLLVKYTLVKYTSVRYTWFTIKIYLSIDRPI